MVATIAPKIASEELLLRAPLELRLFVLVADTAAATEPMVALGTSASRLPFIADATVLNSANPTAGVS